MHRLKSKIGITAFLLGFFYNLQAHVILDYPQGGETFIVGETVTIQWHVYIPHNTINWDLYFSPDGGNNWQVIQLDIPVGQLTYQWEVPDNLTSLGKVKVIQDNTLEDYQDISGNFNIEVITLPPFIDLPALDTIIHCNLTNQQTYIQSWLDNHGGANATNYCGTLIWTNDFTSISNGCGASGYAVVNFTATDECGSTMTNAIVTVIDSDAPVVELPAMDMVVESNGTGNTIQLLGWISTRGGAIASDVCGNLNWTNNFSSLSNGCGSTGFATVMFTASDECGNITTTNATFTIEDSVAPSIIATAHDTTVQCGVSNQAFLQNWLTNHAGSHATDVGGAVTWTNNFSGLSDGCGATGSASVIFIATDECGNSATTSATFTIQDNIAPKINTSAHDSTIVCGVPKSDLILQNWLTNRGGAQASDVCSSINWTNNYSSLSDSCSTTGNAHVIFTAKDECGNSASTSATFSIIDTLDPVINVPAHDTTIQCGIPNQEMIIQQWLESHGGANASDNCGNINWTNDFPVISDTCNNGISRIVTFTATDECGNASVTNANFTLLGTTSTANPKYPDFDFKVYPNPADEILKVDFEKSESINIKLSFIDAYGKLIWSRQVKAVETVIPVNEFPSGIYFLQVKTDLGIYSRKVIIE